MDIFGTLPTTRTGNNYILSIQDQFTKYLILITLKDTEAESIIEGLFVHYIYTFGVPKHIHTDQGANFVSNIVKNFETLFRIRHIKTSTCHPQSNGSLQKITLDSKRSDKNMYGR